MAPWGACGISDSRTKLVRNFGSTQSGIVRFTCGYIENNNPDSGYGFQHIKAKHVTKDKDWPIHAAMSISRNGTPETWPMLFDWSVQLTLDDPDRITAQDGDKVCYERVVFLIERNTGRVVRQARVKAVHFGTGNPQLLTSLIGGSNDNRLKCQGNILFATPDDRLRPGFLYGLRAMGEVAYLPSGFLYQSSGTPAVTVREEILKRFGQLGWENGILGYPVTPEFCGYRDGGCFSGFQYENASIYWSPNSGAHFIRGAIKARWGESGWENGPYGYPTSDEFCGLIRNGCGQHFQRENGSVYWSPGTGPHVTQGLIKQRWAELGWERGELGYPKSDEYVRDGTVFQDFEGGWLAWSGGDVYGEPWVRSAGARFGKATDADYEKASQVVGE